MCGIAGRFNFRSGAPIDPRVIAGMCSLLAHRGPDGEGVDTFGDVGLGQRRLAIIDLTEAGRQPMSTVDGRFTITFNGEIYNFQELRIEFERRGWRFRSQTDTEVILAAYAFHGTSCVEKLRGMFAFAIWDAAARRLFVARDRLGKKPLFYRLDADGLAFASEPKAFLAEPGFWAEPDHTAIAHYLAHQYVPSPESAFRNVRKLPPAHVLIVENGKVAIERYWKLSYAPKRHCTDNEACEELLALLDEATRLRLISDVRLGAFLSGGVDSSAIVALMAQHTSGRVKTFSIGFEQREYDELEYARAVAERYSTDHHEFIVTPKASEIFDRLVWYYGEPFADASAIPTYYLSQLTRAHVTVALNGDGGDENFAGYTRYAPDERLTRLERMPLILRRTTAAAAAALPTPRRSDALLSRAQRWSDYACASMEERYALQMMHFRPSLRRMLYTPEFMSIDAANDPTRVLAAAFVDCDSDDRLDAMLNTDVNCYLPDALLVKVDIATMAHSLEGRSPLLDHHVVEFAASLPADMKLRGTTGKYILKKAVRHLLPVEILDRPKKGFGVPLEYWFRSELKELAYDLLLDRRSTTRGYFKPAVLRRLLDEHVGGVRDWHNQLWHLLMLEMWHRMFVDQRPISAPADAGGVSAYQATG